MTIREWICKNEARACADRADMLEKISAPAVVIDSIRKAAAKLERCEIKVSGNNALLDLDFETFEQKKGRGGKMFVLINNNICYFPNAKYGRFITEKD